MNTIKSFGPVSDHSARILVLGNMPGALSHNTQQHYAQSCNAFWRLMGAILGFSAELPYEQRVDALKESGIALWDVLATCIRPGSLDSIIENSSSVPNDFEPFFIIIRRLGLFASMVQKQTKFSPSTFCLN